MKGSLRFCMRLLLALLVWLPALAPPVHAVETVVLVPDDRASWRPSQLFSWLRPGHNFGERSILVETSPPGASLDLFYIRSNFQKRYEQAEAPVKVVLPPRSQAGPRDAVMIRAFREGYRQRQLSVRVSSSQDHVRLELDPLPNTLLAASHSYFAGRGALSFLTKQALQVRVQNAPTGFNVILAETARGEDVALEGLTSPLIEDVEALQLGEDLLVRVTSRAVAEGLDLRSRQSRDELRDVYVYSVEMVPPDGGVAAVKRARQALAKISAADVSGCAAVFDRQLRQSLDPAALARALAPRGAFTDSYLRAAMKRLGQVSPGQQIAMLDGSSFHATSPIEVTAALSQPAEAKGYLALLRAFVSRLEAPESRAATLRGILAPELSLPAFRALLERAQAAESRCRAGSAPAS